MAKAKHIGASDDRQASHIDRAISLIRSQIDIMMGQSAGQGFCLPVLGLEMAIGELNQIGGAA